MQPLQRNCFDNLLLLLNKITNLQQLSLLLRDFLHSGLVCRDNGSKAYLWVNFFMIMVQGEKEFKKEYFALLVCFLLSSSISSRNTQNNHFLENNN